MALELPGAYWQRKALRRLLWIFKIVLDSAFLAGSTKVLNDLRFTSCNTVIEEEGGIKHPRNVGVYPFTRKKLSYPSKHVLGVRLLQACAFHKFCKCPLGSNRGRLGYY